MVNVVEIYLTGKRVRLVAKLKPAVGSHRIDSLLGEKQLLERRRASLPAKTAATIGPLFASEPSIEP